MSTLSPVRLLAVLVATLGLGAPALAATAAAPPANDEPRGALALAAQPHVVQQDTSNATSGADALECTAGASVWYSMQVEERTTVRLSTLGSDYDTVLALFPGPPSSTSPICKDDTVLNASTVKATLQPGTTYYVAVSACCLPQSPGGQLTLTVLNKKPFAAKNTVGATSAGRISGRGFVTGTERCNHPAAFRVDATLSQRIKQWVARGKATVIVPFCHGTASYGLRIDSKTGIAFQPGRRAVLTLSSSAFDGFQTVEHPSVTRVVRLGAGRGALQRTASPTTGFRTLAPGKG